MVEKCCFLFSRVSHRDPKVEPAGLGSGAKVQSPATLLWGLTPATTAHQTLLRGLTPVCRQAVANPIFQKIRVSYFLVIASTKVGI